MIIATSPSGHGADEYSTYMKEANGVDSLAK